MKHNVPIGYETQAVAEQALAIAKLYQLHLDQACLPRLQMTEKGLVLLMKGFSPLMVDFEAELKSHHKIDKHHSLIRACKPKPGMNIFDVTAGWGRDAALLAYCGAHVTLIERQAMMAALLADGLQRLHTPHLHLSLVYQDALIYLEALSSEEYPDIIYIDPMHPERQKSALVKKDMQALQQLFGPDDDAEALIRIALKRTKKKVVVKWPQRLPPLITPKDSMSGKNIRFDIYF
ncbi:MAG: SAM-dependent methyltransferase [Legionella sp.]|nr:MAG: SAM-dependent methyltransferase [Legionella sp.]